MKTKKQKTDFNPEQNNTADLELEDKEKIAKTSRRKRGFQMKEAELSSVENKSEGRN